MKTALIFGRAKTVWDEIDQAQDMCKFDYVLGVGPTAAEYPGTLDCWVWFHTELFKMVAERRAKNGFAPAKSYWGIRYRGRVRGSHDENVQFLDWDKGGSSGLVATIIALRKYQVDRVALAGIPMTAEGGQCDTPKLWNEAVAHQHSWKTVLPELLGRVRSFSGWTLNLLEGQPPTTDWLKGVERVAA